MADVRVLQDARVAWRGLYVDVRAGDEAHDEFGAFLASTASGVTTEPLDAPRTQRGRRRAAPAPEDADEQ